MTLQSLHGAGHRNTGALRSLCWAFTLGTVLAGCYRNVPVQQPAQLSAGATVRIQLTLDGTQQLASVLGPEVRSVTGKVDAARNDTLFLLLQESRTLNGMILPSSGSRVGIPRAFMADVIERQPNKRRSILASVLIGGAAILILVIASGAVGGGGGDGTSPPPPPPT